LENHLSFSFTNNIVWYGSGTLLSSSWDKVRIFTDNNCYWDTRTKEIRFAKLSFAEWQKSGKDIHSVIADPGFANPAQFDFRIKNQSLIRKIGFKPFDYSQAGVYGTSEWKKMADFDPEIATNFDAVVVRNEYREK
jgi:hypothetical protein